MRMKNKKYFISKGFRNYLKKSHKIKIAPAPLRLQLHDCRLLAKVPLNLQGKSFRCITPNRFKFW